MNTSALANVSCTQCGGLGWRAGNGGASTTCTCVLRAVFRACHERFRRCVETDKSATCVRLERIGIGGGGGNRGLCYGRKTEEYIADFFLMSRRTLTPGTEWDLFRFHYLLGG